MGVKVKRPAARLTASRSRISVSSSKSVRRRAWTKRGTGRWSRPLWSRRRSRY